MQKVAAQEQSACVGRCGPCVVKARGHGLFAPQIAVYSHCVSGHCGLNSEQAWPFNRETKARRMSEHCTALPAHLPVAVRGLLMIKTEGLMISANQTKHYEAHRHDYHEFELMIYIDQGHEEFLVEGPAYTTESSGVDLIV